MPGSVRDSLDLAMSDKWGGPSYDLRNRPCSQLWVTATHPFVSETSSHAWPTRGSLAALLAAPPNAFHPPRIAPEPERA